MEHEKYIASKGKMFFIRSNEMHCLPTITSSTLDSVNLHITPYYLWSICSDYIEAPILQTIMQKTPINHEYTEFDKYFITLKELLYKENSQSVNSAIRRNVLLLIMQLCDRISNERKTQLAISNTKATDISKFKNIQKAISYMDSHFDEKIKIDTLASITNFSLIILCRI